MSQSADIRNEILEISALVAGIGNINPYTLPSNYFPDLADSILQQVNSEDDKTFLTDYRETGRKVYDVPADYFSSLPDAILSRLTQDKGAKEELSEISPLLSEVPNSVPYTIPPNYFGELVDDVISGAQAIDFVNQKLEIESSFVHRMPRKNVYSVPPGYFLKLPYTILQKVNARRSSAPIFRIYKKAIGFAAAAAFAGVISLAGWLHFHNTGVSGSSPEIAGLDKIGSEEISNYLESAPVSPTETAKITVADSKNDEIKQLLADVSNEELERYLDQHSVSRDLMTD